MKTLKIIGLILLFALFGCADGDDGENGKDLPPDVTSDLVTNLTGKAEAGPCYLLSDVSAMSMTALFVQSGYVLGATQQNDGSYLIPGSFAGPFLVYDFDGTCYSEGDNTDVSGVRMKMGQAATATSHNINHATTWRYYLSKRYYEDPAHPEYQDLAGAFVQARTDIYSFLNFAGATKNFYELSITGDTTADAYLLAFEAAVTKGRNGPQQSNYIGQAVNAVINNDTTFRDNLRNTVVNLPIYQIHKNLKAKLVSLGFSVNPAPIYNLPFYPEYYAHFMNGGTVNTLEEYQTSAPTCTIDTNFADIAYPFIFTDTDAAYIALKTSDSGNFSVWSNKTCTQGADSFPCPNAKLFDVTKLREKLIDSNFEYNGKLEGAVTTANLWLRSAGTARAPSKGGQGNTNKFASLLASNDGGVSWVGYNNSTACWTGSIGVKTTD